MGREFNYESHWVNVGKTTNLIIHTEHRSQYNENCFFFLRSNINHQNSKMNFQSKQQSTRARADQDSTEEEKKPQYKITFMTINRINHITIEEWMCRLAVSYDGCDTRVCRQQWNGWKTVQEKCSTVTVAIWHLFFHYMWQFLYDIFRCIVDKHCYLN